MPSSVADDPIAKATTADSDVKVIEVPAFSMARANWMSWLTMLLSGNGVLSKVSTIILLQQVYFYVSLRSV